MTNIQSFDFNKHLIRTLSIENTAWFIAKDIGDSLGYANISDALNKHVLPEERSSVSLGRQGRTNIVNESGMYALVLKSRKKEAIKFRKWVTSEVLPTIRKTGGYGLPSMTEGIRLHELRLKLIKELGKADCQQLRTAIYQSLESVSQALGLSIAPLVDFEWGGVAPAVRQKAAEIDSRFHQAISALAALGVVLDHSTNGDYYAINLNEAIAAAQQHEIDMPSHKALIRYLPFSPRFLQQKPVCSDFALNAAGKPRTVKCWIFSSHRLLH
ncbi:BRO-N domain-containing protein [Ostreibacterium oceani]|uniref:Bro-N domain-containing protein n=1 Tax=Ostreibacterium oceani TaxID=2654998 RepID=A0A6N7EZD7_9GAMM|nr:BRO family protein [Ostreibacterium oceani]MPV86920.1 hypothetical protein [Ostreibacterium oceani]